jgi:hypothetical protein
MRYYRSEEYVLRAVRKAFQRYKRNNTRLPSENDGGMTNGSILSGGGGVVRAKSSLALLFTSTDNKSHFLNHTFLYLSYHIFVYLISFISHIYHF